MIPRWDEICIQVDWYSAIIADTRAILVIIAHFLEFRVLQTSMDRHSQVKISRVSFATCTECDYPKLKGGIMIDTVMTTLRGAIRTENPLRTIPPVEGGREDPIKVHLWEKDASFQTMQAHHTKQDMIIITATTNRTTGMAIITHQITKIEDPGHRSLDFSLPVEKRSQRVLAI